MWKVNLLWVILWWCVLDCYRFRSFFRRVAIVKLIMKICCDICEWWLNLVFCLSVFLLLFFLCFWWRIYDVIVWFGLLKIRRWCLRIRFDYRASRNLSSRLDIIVFFCLCLVLWFWLIVFVVIFFLIVYWLCCILWVRFLISLIVVRRSSRLSRSRTFCYKFFLWLFVVVFLFCCVLLIVVVFFYCLFCFCCVCFCCCCCIVCLWVCDFLLVFVVCVLFCVFLCCLFLFVEVCVCVIDCCWLCDCWCGVCVLCGVVVVWLMWCCVDVFWMFVLFIYI